VRFDGSTPRSSTTRTARRRTTSGSPTPTTSRRKTTTTTGATRPSWTGTGGHHRTARQADERRLRLRDHQDQRRFVRIPARRVQARRDSVQPARLNRAAAGRSPFRRRSSGGRDRAGFHVHMRGSRTPRVQPVGHARPTALCPRGRRRPRAWRCLPLSKDLHPAAQPRLPRVFLATQSIEVPLVSDTPAVPFARLGDVDPTTISTHGPGGHVPGATSRGTTYCR